MSKRIPHEFLMAEDYYESKGVGTRAKSNKSCSHCGKMIPMGEPHDMHHFYPEFNAYATHKDCSADFVASLRTEEDGDPYEDEEDEDG
jgi:ribosomal protein S27AE